MPAERHLISRTRRKRILKRDHYTCRYCGATRVQLEIDHVIPVFHGGTNDDSNLVAACAGCNGRKGSMSADAFRATP